MDRFSGYWWSPDSKKIAYQETDAKGVEVWYVADPFHPEQVPTPSFYPRPGKANVKVRLGVVSIEGEKPRTNGLHGTMPSIPTWPPSIGPKTGRS